jgi:hypothetical protein
MLRDETDLSRKTIYIGHTLFVHPTINRIRPLAVAHPSGWQPIEDAEQRFPDAGTVFSIDPLVVGRDEGYVVLFTIAKNQKYERGHDHDQFITDEVCEPYEVIAAFDVLSFDERRETATVKGFARERQQLSRVILPLGGGKCAFPEFRFDAKKGRWLLSTEEDLSRIKIYEADDATIGGSISVWRGFFALPGRHPARNIGIVNWESDTEFFDRMMNFIRRTRDLRPGSELSQVSKAVIGRLRAAYVRAEVLNAIPGENAALRDRLPSFLTRTDGDCEAIDNIAQSLMDDPTVRSAIDSLVKERADVFRVEAEKEIRSELRAKVELEIGDLSDRKNELTASIDALKMTRERTEAEIQRLAEIRRFRLSDAESYFSTFLEKLRDSSAGFAELIETFRSLGIRTPLDFGVDGECKIGNPPWAWRKPDSDVEISIEEFPAALASASAKAGIPRDVVTKLDIVVRSGEVAILTGEASYPLLNVYASCLTAGALYRVALDPTMLGIDDLWIHPTRRKETAFALAWESAIMHPDRPHLVCLDDIDAASLSNWLPRLAAMFRESRPANLFVIATRTTVEPSDQRPRTLNERSGIIIEANSFPNLTTAILHCGGLPPVPKFVLKAPYLADLCEDDRIKLVAGCDGGSRIGAENASRLASMVAAAKAWVATAPRSEELPYEIFELKSPSVPLEREKNDD